MIQPLLGLLGLLFAQTAAAAELVDLLAHAPEDVALADDEIFISDRAEAWGSRFGRRFGQHNVFDRSYALVIGVSQYDSHWDQLEATENDPLRVRQHLIEHEGFDAVITLKDRRATKARIQYLMQDVFPEIVGRQDRLLFYFSGHGTERQIGNTIQGYLPLSASGHSFSRMIGMHEVQTWDSLLHPGKQVLFLIDSCFSGLAGVRLMNETKRLPVGRLVGYGHHLITAGTKDEETIASESAWGGSIFTHFVLRGIAGSADTETKDFNHDGVVSLAELEEYVSRRIEEETDKLGYKITPQVYALSGDNVGEFFFLTAPAHMTGPEAMDGDTERTGGAAAPQLRPVRPTAGSGNWRSDPVEEWLGGWRLKPVEDWLREKGRITQ